MATFQLAFLPTMFVLKNGGRMRTSELAEKLGFTNPLLFRNDSHIDYYLFSYTACLKREGEFTVFDRNARSYTKIVRVYERQVQAALHGAIPDMERYQLYPFKTRKNSTSCYLGISWKEIPDLSIFGEKEKRSYPIRCDASKGNCTGSCGISDESLDKLGFRRSS